MHTNQSAKNSEYVLISSRDSLCHPGEGQRNGKLHVKSERWICQEYEGRKWECITQSRVSLALA
jgi:hypothetical protein